MGKSLVRKMLKWVVLTVPWLLALVLAAGWWLTVWTPGYLERLVPEMAAEMGLELTEFQVRQAGLFSADIGPVQMGRGEGALRLANVHVTYTPASLKMRRVNSVVLDGLRLACSWDGQTVSLPALDLLPKGDGADGGAGDKSIPALPLDSIVIRDSTLDCDIEGRRLAVPFEGEITPGESLEFAATVTPRDQTVRVDGALGPTLDDLALTIESTGLEVGAFADFLPLAVKARADLKFKTAFNLTKLAELRADFDLSLTHCDLRALGVELAEGAVAEVKGTVAEEGVRFSVSRVSLAEPFPASLTIPAASVYADALSAQFDLTGAGVEMGGRFTADRKQDESGLWDVTFTAANPDRLAVETPGRTIHLNGFIFSVAGVAGPETADVVLNCGTRAAALGGTDLTTGPMRLTLPLKWPAPKRHTPGKVALSRFRLGQRELGNVTAKVRQQGTDVAFDGTLFTDLLPKLIIPFSGLSSMVSNHSEVAFRVDDYVLPEGFDPATLAPTLKGVVLTGTIKGDGGVRMDENGLESWGGAIFRDGSVTLSEGKTTVTGINATFETPDLTTLRSRPAQKLTFDSARAGNIVLTNGRVVYQLESMGSLLVEQAGFEWCGGHVSSRAFRIVPESREYTVTLFCSELRLSEILGQLGLARAKGEAAMSGELPVTWKNGKISFNHGFLHSTPGEGGSIQVDAMEDLVAAIPEGTPQRGQIELAREAVKDFEYKWVRIKADTVGEDLLVRLSVDGKPASTLPFVYRREFGGFMRVTGDVKGSNFQGLRLDVNFSVPLDRILLYKDITRMIE